MDTMRAVVKTKRAEGAEIRDIPIPEPGPLDVQVEVKATSICGTDYHIWAWDTWAAQRVQHLPQTMGHECSGIVRRVGAAVQGIEVGDHVSVETHVTCGRCFQCRTGQSHICQDVHILGVDRDGTFADFVVVPAVNIWKNTPEMPFEIAAIQEPMGNAVHTALAVDLVGKEVAITGCGAIGLMAIGIARTAGAARVYATDVNDYRLDLARQMGADVIVDARSEHLEDVVRERSGGHGLDVVLEMSGHPGAIVDALKACRMGATASLLGLPSAPFELDLAELVIMRGIRLLGITGRRMFETWYQTRGMLESGRLDVKPVITHHLPLERVGEAMELLHSGDCGKIVLIP